MLKHLVSAAAGFSVMTGAHMFISSPPPIEGSAPKDPLDASGSNFPCHGIQLPTSGGEPMAAGSSQVLSWELANGANTAVHGGGSCQISITYETDQAKVKDPKNWYVIYSIESGCPSNTHQNLDHSFQGPSGNTYSGSLPCSDPTTNGVDCVNQFNFTIPQGVKDGHAILAWTWFNSVGNREMYMNCVNAQLSGGDGSEMTEFPSMFVANMASVNQCPTTQSVDLRFPFPGKYVTTKAPSGEAAKTAILFPSATPSGQGCASDGAPVDAAVPGSGSGISATISVSSTAPPSDLPATGTADTSATSGDPQATDSGDALVFVTITAPTTTGSLASPSDTSATYFDGTSLTVVTLPLTTTSSTTFVTYSANAPVTVTTLATITATALGSDAPSQTTTPAGVDGSASSMATESGAPPSSSACPSGQVSCATPGSVLCIGSDQWGECDIDNCAVAMDLAPGTSCSDGVIAKRSMRYVRPNV